MLRVILLVCATALILFSLSTLYFRNSSPQNTPSESSDIPRPKNVQVAPYYPKIAFRTPPDVEKDRVATSSAYSIRLPIIMYHYVEYVADSNDLIRIRLNITPAMFESQLRSLRDNNYHTIFVRDVPNILTTREIVPEKSVALTFDDGYEDFYTYVFPLLKKYQLKATIYVMYNYIGRRGYLASDQITEILNSGLVELGSHTLDHADLPMEKTALAWREIYDNKVKLENLFGVPVPSFAYPYGAFSKETIELVKKAGYTSSVSVIPGASQSDANLFYLSRLRPGFLWGSDPVKTLESYLNKEKRVRQPF